MHLLDHVSISVPDLDAVRPFYDAVMASLGADKVYDRPQALGYGARCAALDTMSTYLAIYETPGIGTDTEGTDTGRHWCFKASSRTAVDAFHRAGLEHGGRDDGAPGTRAHYHPHYYAAFLLDPAGNRVEAVCHAALP